MAHGRIDDYRKPGPSLTQAAERAGVYLERSPLHVETTEKESTDDADGGSAQEKTTS